MAHGPVGRKPRRDIAAQDGVNRAIDRREQKKRVGHNLPQRRENAGRVQRQVSAERKDKDDHETGEQSPNAATDTPRRLLFIHDLRPSSAMRTNAVPTIYNAKNFQEKPGCPSSSLRSLERQGGLLSSPQAQKSYHKLSSDKRSRRDKGSAGPSLCCAPTHPPHRRAASSRCPRAPECGSATHTFRDSLRSGR